MQRGRGNFLNESQIQSRKERRIRYSGYDKNKKQIQKRLNRLLGRLREKFPQLVEWKVFLDSVADIEVKLEAATDSAAKYEICDTATNINRFGETGHADSPEDSLQTFNDDVQQAGDAMSAVEKLVTEKEEQMTERMKIVRLCLEQYAEKYTKPIERAIAEQETILKEGPPQLFDGIRGARKLREAVNQSMDTMHVELNATKIDLFAESDIFDANLKSLEKILLEISTKAQKDHIKWKELAQECKYMLDEDDDFDSPNSGNGVETAYSLGESTYTPVTPFKSKQNHLVRKKGDDLRANNEIAAILRQSQQMFFKGADSLQSVGRQRDIDLYNGFPKVNRIQAERAHTFFKSGKLRDNRDILEDRIAEYHSLRKNEDNSKLDAIGRMTDEQVREKLIERNIRSTGNSEMIRSRLKRSIQKMQDRQRKEETENSDVDDINASDKVLGVVASPSGPPGSKPINKWDGETLPKGRQYMTKEDYVRQYQERKWNQVTKAKMKRMAKTLGVKHKIKRKKCVVQ